MTVNKERLEILLDGGIPDIPPHFEIDFHLHKELFDIRKVDPDRNNYSSDASWQDAVINNHIEIQHRLIEDLGYACVSFCSVLPPEIGITKVKEAVGDRALVRSHEWCGVFWMPSGDEIMDFIVKMYERPDEMHAEARQKCDAAKELLKQQFDAGADFAIGCYDVGFNEGPFISPGQFREFVTPYLAEIVDSVHAQGKKIMMHSDGNINELLDQIYSTGIDGYQSVDPQGHMNIQEVRERFPDWLLMGNVNCSMLQGCNEADIRESVQYAMKHGGLGKRFIFSTSNCIFPGMPPESYRIMLDEYKKQCEQEH